MSEWTKGDWEINPVRDPESGAVMVCAGDGHRYGLVACVFRAADARLIAAAPTMAEALEEAERTFRHYGDLHAAKPDPVKAQRNYEMADKMLAALQLAKGEDRNG